MRRYGAHLRVLDRPVSAEEAAAEFVELVAKETGEILIQRGSKLQSELLTGEPEAASPSQEKGAEGMTTPTENGKDVVVVAAADRQDEEFVVALKTLEAFTTFLGPEAAVTKAVAVVKSGVNQLRQAHLEASQKHEQEINKLGEMLAGNKVAILSVVDKLGGVNDGLIAVAGGFDKVSKMFDGLHASMPVTETEIAPKVGKKKVKSEKPAKKLKSKKSGAKKPAEQAMEAEGRVRNPEGVLRKDYVRLELMEAKQKGGAEFKKKRLSAATELYGNTEQGSMIRLSRLLSKGSGENFKAYTAAFLSRVKTAKERMKVLERLAKVADTTPQELFGSLKDIVTFQRKQEVMKLVDKEGNEISFSA